MVEAKDLFISPGTDAESLIQETTALVDNGRWTLCNDGKGLERTIRFKTFKTTWDFMTSIATECKSARHHPEWTNVYNRVHVRWTTHSPEGLSGKDTKMAGVCDREAEKFGEVVPDGERDWKSEVKDCCGGGGEGKGG